MIQKNSLPLLLFFALLCLVSQPLLATPASPITCYKDGSIPMTPENAGGPAGTHWNVFSMNCEFIWSNNILANATGEIMIGISGKTTKIIKQLPITRDLASKISFNISQNELDKIPKKTHLKAPGGGNISAYELLVYVDIKTTVDKVNKIAKKYLLTYGE